MKPEAMLDAAVRDWARQVEEHLRLMADRNLLLADEAPRKYRFVVMPNKDQLFHLLNWKVWSMRYKVSLDFIMTFVFAEYNDRRRPSKDPWTLSFGFPVQMVTGAACRRRLEEEVARLYPNGENYKAAKCAESPVIKRLNYSDPEKMMEQYGKVMRERHKNPLIQITSKRAYRKD